jgi:hypothetical protein
VNQPTKPIRLGGCTALALVAAALLFVGCGGPEGAGSVNMSAVKQVAASRGLPDGTKRPPAAENRPKPRRGKASIAPIKPQRGGHQ